jgi:ribonucleotide reductase alpha subunit
MKASLARSPYVDQTQSMNLFMANPDYKRLGSAYIWAWKNEFKTVQYYLRTKPSTDAIKFTVDPKLTKMNKNLKQEDNNCENCSA